MGQKNWHNINNILVICKKFQEETRQQLLVKQEPYNTSRTKWSIFGGCTHLQLLRAGYNQENPSKLQPEKVANLSGNITVI